MARRFQYVLRKKPLQTLGLHCSCVNGQVRVNKIEEGGVVDSKNAKLENCANELSHQVLQAGDIVECVNGQTGQHAIMRQLVIESVIHMRIRRGTLTDVVDVPTVVSSANDFERGGTMTVMSDYDPRHFESESGYLHVAKGEEVNIMAKTLTPGGSENSFDHYVYGFVYDRGSVLKEGWVPTFVLSMSEW